MLSFWKNKKQLFSFCLILLISSLTIFFLGVQEAKAVDLGIVDGMKSLLGGFFLMIQELLGAVVTWLAGLAQGTLEKTNSQNTQIVQEGWGITRDLVNMLFVLILLTIAIATILRLETYGMKALLPKLIIAALLINFSLVLAGAVIDFSNILTDFFIQDSTSFFSDIAGQMGLAKLQLTNVESSGEVWKVCQIGIGDDCRAETYSTQEECNASLGTWDVLWDCEDKTPPKVDWTKIPGDKYWKVIASLILSIIFTIIAAFVFGAMAFLFLTRTIIIRFLLILAPLAWFFWILPATQHLFGKWWNTFIKWVFFAPAAVFFIWLSVNSWLKFISGQAPSGGEEIISGMRETITNELTQSRIMPQVMLPENLVQFLLACGMLIGALIVAQKMGIHGASGAIKLGKWFGQGAGGIANRWLAGGAKIPGFHALARKTTEVARYAGLKKTTRGLEAVGRFKRKAASYVSPGVWKKGWVARREEAEREAFRLPGPALQDNLTRLFSLGKEKSDHLERAKRRERIEERKKIETTNAEELTGGCKKALKAGLGSKAAAYMQAAAEQGDLNDLMAKVGPGYDFNAEGISKFVEEQLVPLYGEQDAYRLGHDLIRSQEKTGEWKGRVFKSKYNPGTGKTTYTNLIKELGPENGTKESLKEAYKAWSRMEPQERARFIHRTSVISEDKDGNDLGTKGHELWISGLQAEHAKRIPDEVVSTLMFKHSDETKKENKELHTALGNILEDKTDEQIKMMKEMVGAKTEEGGEERVAPGVKTSSWSPGQTKTRKAPFR